MINANRLTSLGTKLKVYILLLRTKNCCYCTLFVNYFFLLLFRLYVTNIYISMKKYLVKILLMFRILKLTFFLASIVLFLIAFLNSFRVSLLINTRKIFPKAKPCGKYFDFAKFSHIRRIYFFFAVFILHVTNIILISIFLLYSDSTYSLLTSNI